ncbi:ion channel [Litoreibacter roseus]|uniref:Metal transporter n=1 Tax=Litoreibacter roseus TaxID=2601869 RepID=A0A6N6JMR8_9RHOB|nr:ion channel [Litoreibacter roseus]GFE66749.1 metal transporter [Litoreibacter roseus]
MTLIGQITSGTLLLVLCAFAHVGIIVGSVPWIARLARLADMRVPRIKVALLIGFAFVMIVFAHTLQVWVWAVSLLYLDALSGFENALYFSLVTYTTLGYGDVVLAKEMRLLGAFASVTGLLTFGLSTAFLVALVTRVLPNSLGGD